MSIHAELAIIMDRIRQIYAYERNPTITVSRNTHARLKAISKHRPFAHRRTRRRLQRMRQALRQIVRRKQAEQRVHWYEGEYWYECIPLTAEEAHEWRNRR